MHNVNIQKDHAKDSNDEEDIEESNDDDHGEESTDDDYTMFNSEEDVQKTMSEVFKLALDAFRMDVTKKLIFNACKDNKIELLKAKPRESTCKVEMIKIEDVRERMSRFKDVTFDTNLEMKPIDNRSNILDNCVAVNFKIVGSEATREIAQVKTFGCLHRLHDNIEAAKELPNFKEFLNDLKQRLGLQTSSQVNKVERKAKRVHHLVPIMGGAAGVYLLGMFITVHSLENGSDDNWKALTQELKDNREYLAFCMTIRLANDGVTPILTEQPGLPTQQVKSTT